MKNKNLEFLNKLGFNPYFPLNSSLGSILRWWSVKGEEHVKLNYPVEYKLLKPQFINNK